MKHEACFIGMERCCFIPGDFEPHPCAFETLAAGAGREWKKWCGGKRGSREACGDRGGRGRGEKGRGRGAVGGAGRVRARQGASRRVKARQGASRRVKARQPASGRRAKGLLRGLKSKRLARDIPQKRPATPPAPGARQPASTGFRTRHPSKTQPRQPSKHGELKHIFGECLARNRLRQGCVTPGLHKPPACFGGMSRAKCRFCCPLLNYMIFGF